jgi:Ca2+/Na+ antiporter
MQGIYEKKNYTIQLFKNNFTMIEACLLSNLVANELFYWFEFINQINLFTCIYLLAIYIIFVILFIKLKVDYVEQREANY